MEQLGIDFNATGSVMSKSQLEEQRRKRGECLSCGRKCFQKKLFKMIPITDHGLVLNGRCLNCHPVDVQKGGILAAVSRPATEQDIQRFQRSQSNLKLSGPGVASPAGAATTAPTGPALARRSSIAAATPAVAVVTQPKRAASMAVERTPQPAGSQGAPPARAASMAAERAAPPGARPRSAGKTPRSKSAARSSNRPPSNSSISTSTNATSATGLTDHTSGRSEAQWSGSLGHGVESAKKKASRRRRSSSSQVPSGECASPQDSKPSAHERRRLSVESDRDGRDHINASTDSDPDEILSPEHGILDRGGTVSFVDNGELDREEICEGAAPPFASMNAESNRTLSSMSSMEEDRLNRNGSHRSRPSRKPPTNFNSKKPRPAVYEDEGSGSGESEKASHASGDRRGGFAKKTSPQVSARSLMSASSPLNIRNTRVEAEQRALQKIQRADNNYKDIIRVMKDNPTSDLIQQEAFKSLSNFHFTREDYVVLSKQGTSRAVVEGMRAHQRSSEVQVNGCRALWNLSATTRSQVELIKHGALEAVLAAMDEFPDDAEVQEKAMAALSNLGAVEGNEAVMMSSGAIEKIVTAMNTHSEDSQVQMKGCAAITNLASHDSPLKKAIVAAGGGGAVVVSMGMHPDEVDLQEKALRALRNICANNEENKIEVAKVGGIDAVIGAMQVHRDESAVQEAGAWTLSNLAANVDNKATIGDSGGIDVIIRAMWVHSDIVGVQEWCCRALLALSTDIQNRQVIIEVGGISAMVNAMQAHIDSATVQEKCCGTLSNLAALDEDTKLRIVDEEALDAIVMAMVLHADKRNVQDRACSVLRRLAIPDNVKQMQAANVGELVRAAMTRFPSKCEDKGAQILKVL